MNDEIRANTEIITRIMPIDDARAMGAAALFGEKYDDEVRVLFMGREKEAEGKPFSIELCGGTHARRTGDIGLFKIISESALAAGIRRIEALTGEGALRYFEQQDHLLRAVSQALKVPASEVGQRVESLLKEKKKLEQDVSNLRRELATGGSGGSSNDGIKDIGGIKFISRVLPDFPAKDLKPMADDLKNKVGSGVVVLIATSEGKASIVVGVTKDLTDKFSAVDLVKAGAEAMGGKGGGGRPDMAQAGGPNGSAANDAAQAVERAISA